MASECRSTPRKHTYYIGSRVTESVNCIIWGLIDLKMSSTRFSSDQWNQWHISLYFIVYVFVCMYTVFVYAFTYSYVYFTSVFSVTV